MKPNKELTPKTPRSESKLHAKRFTMCAEPFISEKFCRQKVIQTFEQQKKEKNVQQK